MVSIGDHWEGENVVVTFEEEGKDAVYNMEGQINSFNVSGGSSSTDEVYMFGQKTINFQKPREKFEITVEGVSAVTDAARIAFGDNTDDTAGIGSMDGKEVRSGGTAVVQNRWRVVFWFGAPSDFERNGNVVVPSDTGSLYRIVCTDCKVSSFEQSFDADDMFKFTMTLEFSATDGDAYANLFEEYTTNQAGTALTVLNATAHKGILTWKNTTTVSWTGSYRT
jgi:hypothetical protein